MQSFSEGSCYLQIHDIALGPKNAYLAMGEVDHKQNSVAASNFGFGGDTIKVSFISYSKAWIH